MPLFANLNIQLKILLLLACLGVVTIGVAWYGGKAIIESDGSYSDLVDHTLPDTAKLARVHRRATEMVYAGYKAMAYDGTSAIARSAVEEEMASYAAATTRLAEVIRTEPVQAEMLAPFRDLIDKIHAQVQKGNALSLHNDDEAARQALIDADVTMKQLGKRLADINDARVAATQKTSDGLSSAAISLRTNLLITAFVALGLTMILAAYLSKSQIVNPLARLQDAMRALASGNNLVEIPGTDRLDEVGSMAKSVLVFKQAAIELSDAARAKEVKDAAQRLVVDTLQDRLNKLASGDLTSTIDTHFAAEYDGVKGNFNAAVEALRTLIASVMESAETISTGSAEIAQASEDLARRTEGAAASLEETSAAVTEMNHRIKTTAAAAILTVERANGAIGVVDSGRSVADEAMSAMARVSESAKGIDTVIEGLDKIAFQTRVLAMNAAVEAGRAGEAGRGFAVVADLVSALAMRAEEEAGRARDQLIATQNDVTAAVEMVRRVDGALGAIVGDVNEVHALLETMANDNQAQATTVTQVSTAVTSIDQMTQQNAAMVEQTSAAARNLNSEVLSLKGRAAKFKIGSKVIGNGYKPSWARESITPSTYPIVATVHSISHDKDYAD